MGTFTRRAALVGGTALAVGAAAVIGTRPSNNGSASHSAYFSTLSLALAKAGFARPTLIIDRGRLTSNVTAIRKATSSAGLPLRVVVKSLPVPELLSTVVQGMQTDRLMLFSQEMLAQIAPHYPSADVLMGKPLPVAELETYADRTSAEAASRVQWLIDTPERLEQYAALAKKLDIAVRANIEIDVGLHRGGFKDPRTLVETLSQWKEDDAITLSGLMGYDPHVPSMSDPESAYERSQDIYAGFVSALRENRIADPDALTLNAAGSPTFMRHLKGTVGNEVAVGSAFVKPHDFDLPALEMQEPACFIATPVIKALPKTELPGAEWMTNPMTWYDRNNAQTFFIHGGHWLAVPESPAGLQYNKLFGRSSNQEMLNGSSDITLAPDDYIFLRPTQSEALFLQFGDIAVYENGSITSRWPTLDVTA